MVGEEVVDLGLGEFELALLDELVHPTVGQDQGGADDEQDGGREAQAALARQR